MKINSISINGELDAITFPTKDLRISWKISSDKNNVKQEKFQVKILSTDNDIIYDSGVINSDQSVEFELPVILKSAKDYIVCVHVWDNKGEEDISYRNFSTGLNPEDWQGTWIKPKKHIEGWAPYIRRKFKCYKKEISRAILYVSGLGCGEHYINNQKISEDLIDPPITNYEREVYYRAYDIRPFLKEENAFASILGEGFYSQSRVWGIGTFKYGDVCLIAQIEIEYIDGQKQIISSNADGEWKYKYSPISLNNFYGGETYDSRLETPDFSDPNGDEEEWLPVKIDEIPKGELKICIMPPVRIIRTVPAVSVTQVSGKYDGAWIIDLGENFAGFAEFHLKHSPRGAQYVFRFAETINPDGTLDHRSIGAFATQCIQQDIYIARGDEEGEVWRPRFTYHAFRYIEVTGYHELREFGCNPEISFATGYAISTNHRTVGEFKCDNDDLNNFQKILLNSFRSNYHGIPEDCPGREKCGWLGDAQIVCNTGIMNFNLESSYEKYMNDIRTTTEVYGRWNMISPGKRDCGEATPLWGCAQIIIPYWMYYYYGNSHIVKSNWDLMDKWIDHELADSKDYLISRGLGDWCPPKGRQNPRRIPVIESSTLMFYEICCKMSELCDALNMPNKEKYDNLAIKIKEAFNKNFWIPEKHRYSTCGTCGVALMTNIYPDGEKDALIKALIQLMKEDDFIMPTGIYGNKYLIPALCENGYGAKALDFLFTRTHASFGTMMDDGATSLFEEIDNERIGRPRRFNTASYNHPMHSGFAYFMYSDIAGIQPIKPGFKTFYIKPCLTDTIKNAEATHDSPYGKIHVSYTQDDKEIIFNIRVPENTECQFEFKNYSNNYGSGEYSIKISK